MKRRFATLDVFSDRRFAGNPLAVVLQAEGLETAAMQTIAGEFNLSETVFILAAEHAAHRARYRIFTPRRELPFAGHPTVGTAVLLANLDGGENARDMTLGANVGPVACRVSPGEGHASFDLPTLPVEAGTASAVPALAAALGLAANDIGLGDFAPSCWSAGVPFTFVPLKNLDAVRRAKPDLARFAALNEPQSVFAFSNETAERGHDFHARMFAPSFGVIEDPATGSAAAAFAGALCRFANLRDGSHAFTIEQGYEMGRPSLIHLNLTLAGGALAAASVGGHAVVVSNGTIEA